jgi:hypothetical protein
MLRTGPTGLGVLTGCRGREMLHAEAYEAEANVFSSRSGEPARKFDGCPNHRNSHVILIAAMLPRPQAITEELHAVHADGLCAGAGFFQVDAG